MSQFLNALYTIYIQNVHYIATQGCIHYCFIQSKLEDWSIPKDNQSTSHTSTWKCKLYTAKITCYFTNDFVFWIATYGHGFVYIATTILIYA